MLSSSEVERSHELIAWDRNELHYGLYSVRKSVNRADIDL